MLTIVKAKRVHTMAGAAVEQGVLYIEDGRVSAVSSGHDISADAHILDLPDSTVYPGFIDPASRLGAGKEPYDLRTELLGCADPSDPLAPELRTEDAINPFSPAIDLVRAAGVTTCYAAAGPGALIDGQGISFKLRRAETAAGMCIPGSGQMHFSLGDIPVMTFKEKNQAPMTRMAAAHMLRKAFERARIDPDESPALAKVLCGEMRTRFYCLAAQDIWAAVQLAEHYKLDYVIDGAFEAWKLPETLSGRRPAFVLTSFPFGVMHSTMREKYDYCASAAAKLSSMDCPVALTAGSVANTKMLPYLAGFAAGSGLPAEKALAAITIEAAKVLKLDARIGSLEAGKDADFAVFDGDALLSTTKCLAAYIEGKPVYIDDKLKDAALSPA